MVELHRRRRLISQPNVLGDDRIIKAIGASLQKNFLEQVRTVFSLLLWCLRLAFGHSRAPKIQTQEKASSMDVPAHGT